MGTLLSDSENSGMLLAGIGVIDDRNWSRDYWSHDEGLVLLEDALNLADALENAFMNYEPQHIPSLHYYTVFGENSRSNGIQPSLGAIQGVIDLCYLGMFRIEKV